MGNKELKLKYDADDVDRLYDLLRLAVDKAKEDYTNKKKAKGEEVDYFKMINAVNRRKNIKKLGKICLAATFSNGNILDKPAINRAVEKLEREARGVLVNDER